jgi:hypothetical protein
MPVAVLGVARKRTGRIAHARPGEERAQDGESPLLVDFQLHRFSAP